MTGNLAAVGEAAGKGLQLGVSIQADDAYMIMLAAIEGVGSLDRDMIAEKVRKTKNFERATGNIIMDQNGNPIKPPQVSLTDFQQISN